MGEKMTMFATPLAGGVAADDKGSATIQGAVVVKEPAATMARRLPDIGLPKRPTGGLEAVKTKTNAWPPVSTLLQHRLAWEHPARFAGYIALDLEGCTSESLLPSGSHRRHQFGR